MGHIEMNNWSVVNFVSKTLKSEDIPFSYLDPCLIALGFLPDDHGIISIPETLASLCGTYNFFPDSHFSILLLLGDWVLFLNFSSLGVCLRMTKLRIKTIHNSNPSDIRTWLGIFLQQLIKCYLLLFLFMMYKYISFIQE